jgi:hypothetical protein
MRLGLTLEMGRPQAVIQRSTKKDYRNVRPALSREKEGNDVVITSGLSIQTIGCIWLSLPLMTLFASPALYL